jgi:two-component system CheB/CheR fusion protein
MADQGKSSEYSGDFIDGGVETATHIPADDTAADPLSSTVSVAKQATGPSLPYPVVGIGSSAGGLQPIQELLSMLPVDTGMAFVFVPHLSPDHVSYLRDITERHTTMPVRLLEDGEQPLPDEVYVLQPGQIARIHEGRFAVSQRNREDRIPHTIDEFFRSLGADLQANAIGVVLSGADADGALGLKAIRGEGGMAIVQTPESAIHSDMPRSSILADHADIIVPPAEIGVELGRIAKQFKTAAITALEQPEEPLSDGESFQRILQMLRTNSGLDLRQYKPDTIRRRIARRMVLLRFQSLSDYSRYLQLRKDELTNLKEDVLIGVTRFFRDPSFWHSLSTDILPTFFRSIPPQRPIRIWCAGCSTGEEVYSLAITFLEYLTANSLDNTLQIFGTDASDRSIETARLGTYPESLINDVSPDRIRRFFVKVDHGFQLTKRVRDLCIFARQNLAGDPPFSRMDFVSCRNVLIYFDQALQRQVIQTFHYALELSGYLLLGMSETLRDYHEEFSLVDRKNKIYTKLGASMPGGYHLPMHRILGQLDPTMTQSHNHGQVWSDLELQRNGDRVVLARFAPPGLIVDEHLKVMQVRGQTAPYIQLASGSVSWNLLRVLRDGLAEPVREAVQHSIAERIPVSRITTLTDEDGQQRQIQTDVLPLSQKESGNCYYMILFQEIEIGSASQSMENQLPPQMTMDEKENLVAQLRQDLSSTRFHLQSLLEERDARNQELVSANEEIQSANEELQSTNEELETTKEELQSANEELQTVNDELQQRNAVLTQTGNDLNNLLTSVNIPLLMLTETLQIRQFTPPMERLLNIRSSDINRPISEIRLQLSIENIEPILYEVLETLGTREVEVQDREGRWHLMRIRPYRTSENKIEGLVLVLVDIDQLRNSQQGLREARDFANSLVASVPVPVVVLETDCRIKQTNTAFRELTQLQPQELMGRSLPDLVKLKWGVDQFREKLETLVSAEPGTILSFEHHSTTEDRRILSLKGQVLPTDSGKVILLTMADITAERSAQEEVASQKIALEKQVETTTQTLIAAQLELRELAAHLFRVQEDERERVARELHDDIAQRLSLLQMTLQNPADLERKDNHKIIESAVTQVEALGADIRQLSHRLHPAILEDLGLTTALRSLVQEFEQREQMFTTYMGQQDLPEVSRTAATAIYRVTQEALRNVAKHAGKTHVKVILESRDGLLNLEIRDFGLGFDQADLRPGFGLGLVSMKERARIAGGKLEVRSNLGEGTTITMQLPLDASTVSPIEGHSRD